MSFKGEVILPINRKGQRMETAFKGVEMTDLADNYFKTVIINMLNELRN